MVTGRFEGILPPMWLFSRDLPQNNNTRSLDDSTYEMRVGVKVIDCPPKINMYRGPGGRGVGGGGGNDLHTPLSYRCTPTFYF